MGPKVEVVGKFWIKISYAIKYFVPENGIVAALTMNSLHTIVPIQRKDMGSVSKSILYLPRADVYIHTPILLAETVLKNK